MSLQSAMPVLHERFNVALFLMTGFGSTVFLQKRYCKEVVSQDEQMNFRELARYVCDIMSMWKHGVIVTHCYVKVSLKDLNSRSLLSALWHSDS